MKTQHHREPLIKTGQGDYQREHHPDDFSVLGDNGCWWDGFFDGFLAGGVVAAVIIASIQIIFG